MQAHEETSIHTIIYTYILTNVTKMKKFDDSRNAFIAI